MRYSCSAYCILIVLIPVLTACSSMKIPQSQTIALADRISWGANSETLTRINNLGAESYLDQQLHPGAPASLPLQAQQQINSMEISRKSMVQLTNELDLQKQTADAIVDQESRKLAQQKYWQHLYQLGRETATRSLLRDLYSPQQLQEQMTWFWMNHFSVYQDKNGLRTMLADYEDQMRKQALGRFRDLLETSTRHPAMLLFLDNHQNARGHINENLARELMELHTLGVDGGYSQRDVQELARILTGLGVNRSSRPAAIRRELLAQYRRHGLVEFNPQRHDYGSKVFLGQPVHTQGEAELEDALDRLARHPATARFISRKLAVYFVRDTPSQGLIDAMTQRYLHTDGQIAAVLQTLFHSTEFRASLGQKFRDPLHYLLAGIRRAYDGKVILNPGPLFSWLNRMGEPLYGHSTPEGYQLTEAAWSSPGQMTTRIEIARAMGNNSAGLFRPEGISGHEEPAFPLLANAMYYQYGQAAISRTTRKALEQAQSPQEWNLLLLSSPEFMYR
jgi:uncharacterized protein (DUF1800 family)